MDADFETLIREAATARGWEPDALLALLDVESAGNAFAPDGRPVIAYEGHVAYRVATPAARETLVADGLAWPGWRDRPYLATQAERWRQVEAVAARAGRSVAVQATSWGAPQILGEGWRTLGLDTPLEVERLAATIEGQAELLTRFIDGKKLGPALAARDWLAVARGYNGAGQARHDYAGRLERAWRARTGQASPVVLREGAAGAQVRRLQSALADAGFVPRVAVDGVFGAGTRAAVEEYQRRAGLTVDGVVGARTWAALSADVAAAPAPQPVDTPVADHAASGGRAVVIGGSSILVALEALRMLGELSDAVSSLLVARLGLPTGIVAGVVLVGGAVWLWRGGWAWLQARTAALGPAP